MKNSIWTLVLLFLITLPAKSNMSSPYISGVMPSAILQSSDLDIINEDLKIVLLNPRYAQFEVTYTILNNQKEDSLKLLFDAAGESSNFTVYFNSKPVTIDSLSLEEGYSPEESTENMSRNYSLFTLIVPEGKHTINIQYKGYSDVILREWIKTYSFKYNLKPAKDWKSFKHLDLEIDVTQLHEPATVTIQDSVYKLTGKHKWSFDSIPQDELVIVCSPKGNVPFIIEAEWIFLFVLILLAILNFIWLLWWRKAHVWKKYSTPIIIGSLTIPLISLLSFIFWFPIMDSLIGEYASKYHGYYFLAIIFYPLLALIYFVIAWGIDLIIKTKLRDSNKKV